SEPWLWTHRLWPARGPHADARPAWPPPRAFQPRPPLPIYSRIMLARPRTLPTGFIAPCLPAAVRRCLWLHEIKHDGFRIIARKDGPRVRLYGCAARAASVICALASANLVL